jgi:hypothetical protein
MSYEVFEKAGMSSMVQWATAMVPTLFVEGAVAFFFAIAVVL